MRVSHVSQSNRPTSQPANQRACALRCAPRCQRTRWWGAASPQPPSACVTTHQAKVRRRPSSKDAESQRCGNSMSKHDGPVYQGDLGRYEWRCRAPLALSSVTEYSGEGGWSPEVSAVPLDTYVVVARQRPDLSLRCAVNGGARFAWHRHHRLQSIQCRIIQGGRRCLFRRMSITSSIFSWGRGGASFVARPARSERTCRTCPLRSVWGWISTLHARDN